MRTTVKIAGALALMILLPPAAAMAHVGSAAVSCSAADFQFARFSAGSNTVHWRVNVDNAPAAEGDFTLNERGGTAGAFHVPLTLYGPHVVSAYAWWGPAGTATGETGGSTVVPMASQQVSCAAAPVAAPSAPAAAAPAPPPATPAPAAAAPAPQRTVQGVAERSPARVARLTAHASCTTRTVRVTVNGRQIRTVAFSINGRHIRTVRVRRGARSVNASLPMRTRRAAQVVTARVRFRNGAAPRTLSARTARCAQAAVRPQFTG